MSRKSFDPFKKISVIFTDCGGMSEGAVDMGGPKREMFRLVLKYLEESSLFIGQEKKFLRLNMHSLEKKEYFFAGRIIALSLLHEGPGPHFFSESLYQAITKGIDTCEPSDEFIEEEISNKINRINNFDPDELKEYVLEEQIFSIAGCCILDDKEKLIRDCLRFYNIHRVRPALDQFMDGLKTAGILQLLREHSELFHQIMCGNKTQISSQIMEEIFEFQLSEQGSNKRNLENRLRAFWCDFLVDCEVAFISNLRLVESVDQ
ncbi:G2/M phase-specific E3 ubiquitin-protein ligase-like [Coccinella septempunctata]|uniref:G2/M phase-specific E3 ubiquitin-protein ligase-like n=1 Tax=Coccinella septempunctata TaxID=41139 RepID=UPI001D078C41|nr:G2/M phase-specific E3 ubiquitin-protein ligase-like [Coccinella septempunctata]